ncbi:dienelactone hydrolase family protein [Alphaproteobacteria bacterium]|jgi:dienelactone hydrolase|nr:dienelactone hydrolase family protein [Alphaproteobacteria bacterium]
MKLLCFLFFVLISVNVNAGQKLTYSYNNEMFEGYLSNPKSQSKGLIILIHDWDGLTKYEEKRTDMLSSLGYTVFAVDLYGKGNRPKEMKLRKAETKKLYENRTRMRELILAGINEVNVKKQKTFVMGYCFGGSAALELARSHKGENIVGYASFHGGLKTPQGQSYSANTLPIFIAHGGADKAVKLEDVFQITNELEKNKITYEVNIYSGAPHAFTVFNSKRYRKDADEKSWEAFLSFIDKKM